MAIDACHHMPPDKYPSALGIFRQHQNEAYPKNRNYDGIGYFPQLIPFYNPLKSPVTNASKMITATAPHNTPLPKPILKNASFNHDPDRVPLTVDELVRSRASLGSEQPVICYPRTGIEYVDYPLRQLDIFSFRVAGGIAAKVSPRASSRETPTVVSLLGTSDLSYLVMLLAVAKLGHTGLLLSTRISIEAYVSLLERTNSRHVFIHESFKATAEELKQRLPGLQVEVIPTQESFNYPIPEGNVDTNMVPWLDPVAESKHLAWIIHSSGSTGLPKPIYQTQAAAVKNYSGHMNMSGFITLPLYHNHGISVLFRTIYSSKWLYLYNAELPLTRQHLLDIMQAHPLEIFYGVPYALKLLAETDEGIAALAQFKAVMFGGSACPDSLGNLLVENNVNLISHYGSTETGQLMTSFRPREDKEWDYLRPSEAVKKYLRFEERYPGIFELICLDGWPSKVISNRPDGSYATKDLFVKHPTLEAYKYYARLDDTIVLVNGEKVNPLDMEGRVRQLNTISEAIVFGAGKASIGLAVVRAPGTASMSDQELIESIWPAVEAAHEAMPAYGQLSKSMVRVLPEDTPYPRTDKGTIIRQRFYKEFSNLIEEAYEAEDAMSGSLILSEMELKAFLKDQLRDILAHRKEDELTEDADFFALGMDSLQATQLRSILMKTLNTNGQKLGLNVAFEHPTIGSLARYLDSLHSGATTDVQSVEDQMTELISKYSDFRQHVPMSNGLDGRYIAITGATGSLGAHVVRKLSVRPEVQKIYCLVRAGSPIEGYSRVVQSMRSRRVFDGLTDVAKQKIVALPSDLSQATLGLDATTYSTLTSEITDVIHCAWSVNFNMHLSSFEKDSIGGLKNLLDLCLKAQRPAPASFNFCSSISSVVGTVEDDIPEALPKKLSYAQNMGYAQSKLVSEHICMNAAQQAGICARVLRIGQVIGDQDHGVWNATEAIPLMLQAATTIGALPKLNESPLWLPVDTVAGTVIDISLSSTAISKPDVELVFNIVSHHPFHWTKDLLPYVREAGLEFEELEQRDWIHRLRTSNPDPVANPPIKLCDEAQPQCIRCARTGAVRWFEKTPLRFRFVDTNKHIGLKASEGDRSEGDRSEYNAIAIDGPSKPVRHRGWQELYCCSSDTRAEGCSKEQISLQDSPTGKTTEQLYLSYFTQELRSMLPESIRSVACRMAEISCLREAAIALSAARLASTEGVSQLSALRKPRLQHFSEALSRFISAVQQIRSHPTNIENVLPAVIHLVLFELEVRTLWGDVLVESHYGRTLLRADTFLRIRTLFLLGPLSSDTEPATGRYLQRLFNGIAQPQEIIYMNMTRAVSMTTRLILTHCMQYDHETWNIVAGKVYSQVPATEGGDTYIYLKELKERNLAVFSDSAYEPLGALPEEPRELGSNQMHYFLNIPEINPIRFDQCEDAIFHAIYALTQIYCDGELLQSLLYQQDIEGDPYVTEYVKIILGIAKGYDPASCSCDSVYNMNISWVLILLALRWPIQEVMTYLKNDFLPRLQRTDTLREDTVGSLPTFSRIVNVLDTETKRGSKIYPMQPVYVDSVEQEHFFPMNQMKGYAIHGRDSEAKHNQSIYARNMQKNQEPHNLTFITKTKPLLQPTISPPKYIPQTQPVIHQALPPPSLIIPQTQPPLLPIHPIIKRIPSSKEYTHRNPN
ncbi:hypothetical protein BDV33DRAFT_231569 [Aspergillus novoparasiticus]|uniref:Carrier domain-containing protein n=1 Tax=Aspergillus novoparasiticus TaxID=986946 RepID=A0A5N6EPT1_9EURO|nr:hypothetical protein BDV33DRAFT_231569 [Aspergillus novoparasiticus]